jgi:hypothetical protein
MDPWLRTASAFLARESARPVHDIDGNAELDLKRSSEDHITLSLEKSRDFLGGIVGKSFILFDVWKVCVLVRTFPTV